MEGRGVSVIPWSTEDAIDSTNRRNRSNVFTLERLSADRNCLSETTKMPIATGLALGLAGISAAGGVAGAAMQSNAAGNAASAQSRAAMQAAALQHEDAQAA